MSDSGRLRLMAVFAHPDDEAFGIGGTLARYGADPDVRVTLVCATRGEAGEISNPALASVERLGEVRENELRCACANLGVEELYMLDYRDSGMAGTPENQDPRALTMADAHRVVGDVVTCIRREQPDVVVTFDESGGYGHPDHVAIHYHTKEAFAAAADADRYPEQIEAGLAPYQPKKLYYTSIPRRFFLDAVAKMQELDIEIPERYQRLFSEPMGLPDDACTTDVNVEGFWDTKQTAVECHATQLNPDSIFATLPPGVMRDLQAWECFQLAESYVGGDGDSHDLLAGLRQDLT